MLLSNQTHTHTHTHTHTPCFCNNDKWHTSNFIANNFRVSEMSVCKSKTNQEKKLT